MQPERVRPPQLPRAQVERIDVAVPGAEVVDPVAHDRRGLDRRADADAKRRRPVRRSSTRTIPSIPWTTRSSPTTAGEAAIFPRGVAPPEHACRPHRERPHRAVHVADICNAVRDDCRELDQRPERRGSRRRGTAAAPGSRGAPVSAPGWRRTSATGAAPGRGGRRPGAGAGTACAARGRRIPRARTETTSGARRRSSSSAFPFGFARSASGRCGRARPRTRQPVSPSTTVTTTRRRRARPDGGVRVQRGLVAVPSAASARVAGSAAPTRNRGRRQARANPQQSYEQTPRTLRAAAPGPPRSRPGLARARRGCRPRGPSRDPGTVRELFDRIRENRRRRTVEPARPDERLDELGAAARRLGVVLVQHARELPACSSSDEARAESRRSRPAGSGSAACSPARTRARAPSARSCRSTAASIIAVVLIPTTAALCASESKNSSCASVRDRPLERAAARRPRCRSRRGRRPSSPCRPGAGARSRRGGGAVRRARAQRLDPATRRTALRRRRDS